MTAGLVLLTGATGLIGRQCPAALRALGFEVLAASRAGQPVAGAEGVALDCLDPLAVQHLLRKRRPSHLLHLAWHDGASGRWTAPGNLNWVGASLHLLQAFAAAGGQRVVMVGSCAEYDWRQAAAGALSEESPLHPATLYGAAKAATGMAAMAGAGALALSLAWARPFFCFGPGEPAGRLFGDLIRGLAAGTPVDCTDGVQERDFMATPDLARALAALLASPVTGAVNIGTGRALPVRALIAEVARQMGGTDLVRLGARPRPAEDPVRLLADVTRLHEEVGHRGFLPLEEAVRLTLAAERVAE
ncbi:MAG: NAD(P)-dependent oxidoreductase [Rhodobacteraceae bacterium]|nr:NAD(P)-dependent oxidoreductase [Paracoccaceae bacterium]